jgi:hypothetical protein
MSNQQELASLLPTLLRALADELERDFELAERIARNMKEDSNKKRTKKAAVDFDPFEVLRQGSDSALRAVRARRITLSKVRMRKGK